MEVVVDLSLMSEKQLGDVIANEGFPSDFREEAAMLQDLRTGSDFQWSCDPGDLAAEWTVKTTL